MQIALADEHFDAAPAVLLFTTSLCPSLIFASKMTYIVSGRALNSTHSLPR